MWVPSTLRKQAEIRTQFARWLAFHLTSARRNSWSRQSKAVQMSHENRKPFSADDDSLLITASGGRLFEAVSKRPVHRGDIALMIASGRKYKVIDPGTGNDLTMQLGRFFGRSAPAPQGNG